MCAFSKPGIEYNKMICVYESVRASSAIIESRPTKVGFQFLTLNYRKGSKRILPVECRPRRQPTPIEFAAPYSSTPGMFVRFGIIPSSRS